MSSRNEGEKLRLIHDKCQVILGNLLREEDNKYCVDCDAKGPRWASWNLGVFLCIRCAGVHRNLGVHISRVKSVNLDTWTPEQVACLQQMGNSQARAVYEANLPDNFRRPQSDSPLETFIRNKYEHKKYIAKEWVPLPRPRPAFDIEEERKKERERKKSRSKSVFDGFDITQIPMLCAAQKPGTLPHPFVGPESPSVKNVHLDSSKSQQPAVETADLLNLGESSAMGDSIFEAFLSAPTTKAPANVLQTSSTLNANQPSEINKSSEETDFFNQKSFETPQNKMTKESILSLYGSNANQLPVTQPIPTVYGMPGGMYVRPQPYPQVGIGGFPVTAPMIGASTQHPQMANIQMPAQGWNMGVNMIPVTASNIVFGTGQPASGVIWPNMPNGPNPSNTNNLWQ